jgi:CheY-like chemotaxis protein
MREDADRSGLRGSSVHECRATAAERRDSDDAVRAGGRAEFGCSERNTDWTFDPLMGRILLADDSPHAQRMGERILRDEGHEVVVVSDGKVAMLRLEDASPDLIIADISMPEVSGFELCEYVKRSGGVPVILTAGPVEPIDEKEVDRVRADGILRKPFEASVLLESVGRFVAGGRKKQAAAVARSGAVPVRSVAVIDAEQVRAAVTVALDSAMPGLVDQIAEKVVAVLSGRKSS